MISKVYDKNLFAKLFTLGLLLLFISVVRDFFNVPAITDFFILSSISFFAIGVTLCLFSLPFLMIEWLMLPFGTHTKRIKLYQGAGNLFAFLMLIGGWFIKEQTSQNFTNSAALAFSSGGVIIAVIFGWMGNPIAEYISRKKIKLESFGSESLKATRKAFEKTAKTEPKVFGNKIATDVSRIPAAQN